MKTIKRAIITVKIDCPYEIYTEELAEMTNRVQSVLIGNIDWSNIRFDVSNIVKE